MFFYIFEIILRIGVTRFTVVITYKFGKRKIHQTRKQRREEKPNKKTKTREIEKRITTEKRENKKNNKNREI